MAGILEAVLEKIAAEEKMLAVLIDPEKFDENRSAEFLEKIPASTTHIFIGGSTATQDETRKTIKAVKKYSDLPLVLFPGDHSQVTDQADALLFLSLISGRNPEYLIGQHIKAAPQLKVASLEIIPTGYILIDGGRESAVQKITKTRPIPQDDVENIVNTALAGEYSGKKVIYLEAGSGAKFPVSTEIIAEVKRAISIPLIVGGGIRSELQIEKAHRAGADIVVIGTVLEDLESIEK